MPYQSPSLHHWMEPVKNLEAGIHPLIPHLQAGGQNSSGLSSTAGGGVSAGAAELITPLMHVGSGRPCLCKVQVPVASLGSSGGVAWGNPVPAVHGPRGSRHMLFIQESCRRGLGLLGNPVCIGHEPVAIRRCCHYYTLCTRGFVEHPGALPSRLATNARRI